jgi:hypothetical protein
MNRIPIRTVSDLQLHHAPFTLLRTLIASGITWCVAIICTLCSVSLYVLFRTFLTITHLSFRCVVYILLGTVFLCCAIILGILSIITLGAISLP